MAITALPTPPTRSDPAAFAARGDAFMTALPTFVTEANALQVDVNAKQAAVDAAAASIVADAAKTALDRAATGADRVQTGADVMATATSAATATTQAGNAATSAATATTQAATATTKADEAATSATLSKDWATQDAGEVVATQGYSAKYHANVATTQAATATTQADTATTQAGNAATSANTATTQATTATTKANEAATSATLSKDWATQDVGEVVATQGYSAKYHANVATTQAATATTQAATATTQAGNAATSAATATTQASEAATSATNAEAARAAAVVAQNNAVAVVTGGTGSLTAAPAKLPLANSAGQLDISWLAAISGVKVNDIGVPNTPGAGVGICPAVPAGYTPLAGCTDKLAANHGGYQYSDGSVMHWVPAFWIRRGHPNNPTYGIYGVNSISIVAIGTFPDDATANAEGYYRHRAFINAGAVQPGFFRDKYDCSQNGTIASSLPNVMPMVSGPQSEAATATVAARVYTILSVGTTDFTLIGAASNTVGLRFTATGVGTGTGTVSQQIGFVGCTANGQTPANAYYGALQAAKSRGNKFFPESVFIASALSDISDWIAQAATSTTYCAWYDATGVRNYPKGNDNNALKSEADVLQNGAGAVTFTSAGATTQSNFAKTGSGSVFARTTHNGQACGISDVAGNIYKINPGLTCIATSKAITAATQANPVALTVATHGRTTGDYVQIDSVAGMTQLNDKIYVVTVVDANTLTLNGVDGTAFTAYTSGGTVTNGTFYVLKESVDIAAVTSGTTLATDHWGATGVAAQFDAATLNFATTYPNNAYAQRFGNAANAVFDMSTANSRALAMMGLPAAAGMSTAGSNAMGADYYYQYMRDQLCVLSRGYWLNGSFAGSRNRFLVNYRTYAAYNVGFACASYL